MADTNNQGKSFQERLAEAEERWQNATVSDIIAAKRREADSIETSARGSFKAGEDWDERPFTESDLESALDLAETKRKEADRLEAALKRESGNCAKLREALINVVKRLEAYVGCDHHTFHPTATTCDGITSIGKCGKIATCAAIFKARAALAATPRNCDVGTAEEQAERYGRYCDKFTRDGMHCETCPCCGKIPFGKCEFAWAQMPYIKEEGGTK